MAAYAAGGYDAPKSHNFVSYYDAHEPDISDVKVQRYANTMVGFLDFTNAKKGTSALEFSRFEADRIMPKIFATQAASPAAGAVATFTIDATGTRTIASYDPYDQSATPTEVINGVRVNDLIMIKPASGIVSNGNYVKAIVLSKPTTTTFTARPVNSADTIPTFASAAEIVIYGNAHGEGSGFNSPLSTTATKYTENLQEIKHRNRVTGAENLTKKWFKDDSGRFMIEGEHDSYTQFLNLQDMNLLVGEALSNTGVADTFQAAGTPLALTNGLLTQILGAGNVLNYASVAGLTIDDLYNYNVEIDKNKADKKNLFFTGIELDQQVDRELGDKMKAGSISYGSFSGDQDKAINLSFQKFTLGSYSYDKRCMESFNDLQTLGADGFGFPHEGFTIPASSARVAGGSEMGSSVHSLRKRFLEGKGKSREMMINYYDARTQSADGSDFEEVRYQSTVALEAQALNKFGYAKRV